MAFLPDNYEAPAPTGGNYFKPQDGANRVRVASSAITGYVGWDREGEHPRPVRSKLQHEVMHLHTPPDNKVRHFWAFAVIDYEDDRVKVWEVTQASIRDAITALINSSDWGDPLTYDLVITKSGKGLDTVYSVIPAPIKRATTQQQEAAIAGLDLAALFDGGDPFADVEQDTASVEIREDSEPHPADTASNDPF